MQLTIINMKFLYDSSNSSVSHNSVFHLFFIINMCMMIYIDCIKAMAQFHIKG